MPESTINLADGTPQTGQTLFHILFDGRAHHDPVPIDRWRVDGEKLFSTAGRIPRELNPADVFCTAAAALAEVNRRRSA